MLFLRSWIVVGYHSAELRRRNWLFPGKGPDGVWLVTSDLLLPMDIVDGSVVASLFMPGDSRDDANDA